LQKKRTDKADEINALLKDKPTQATTEGG